MVTQCIVIGASAGGIEPLKQLVYRLPGDLPVPVFIVLHIRPYDPSLLPEILSRAGPLPAIHPKDGAKIEAGTIYIAPPDHHMLIDDGNLAVKRGPKENGFRPSIDALFRSAAYAFGPRVIGVVLSGSLNDGTSGLWSIKRLGGIAIIQEPNQSEYQSMPRNVLEYVDVDYRLPSSEIGTLLARLVQEQPQVAATIRNGIESDVRQMAQEMQIAAGIEIPPEIVLEMGDLTPFTCPECRGALVRIMEDKLTRFRCHTGHAFTEDALLEEAMSSIGDILWQAMRGFQEVEMLLEHMGRHIRNNGDHARAERFLAKARELRSQVRSFQAAAIRHETLSGDKLKQNPPPQRKRVA